MNINNPLLVALATLSIGHAFGQYNICDQEVNWKNRKNIDIMTLSLETGRVLKFQSDSAGQILWNHQSSSWVQLHGNNHNHQMYLNVDPNNSLCIISFSGTKMMKLIVELTSEWNELKFQSGAAYIEAAGILFPESSAIPVLIQFSGSRLRILYEEEQRKYTGFEFYFITDQFRIDSVDGYEWFEGW